MFHRLEEGDQITFPRGVELNRYVNVLEPERFDGGRFADSIALFERISTSASFEEFLTLPAYDILTAG